MLRILGRGMEKETGEHFAADTNPQSIPVARATRSSLHLKNVAGSAEAQSGAPEMITAAGGETGKAVLHVLVQTLVLT